MITKKKINAEVESINKGMVKSFNNVKIDMKFLLDKTAEIAKSHNELLSELATNGVVRDLRKLQKEFAELQKYTTTMITYHDDELKALRINGVATAINTLNVEVFKDKKEDKYNTIGKLIARMSGSEHTKIEEVTLAGKVDAIIQHLGIDITVKPREVTEAKVEVKKKPIAKKKGKR